MPHDLQISWTTSFTRNMACHNGVNERKRFKKKKNSILLEAELKIRDAMRDWYHCCRLQTANLLK